MTEHSSLLGKQIEEYRLENLLGQGGMASVYRGLDTTLRRYVAIKVIDAQFRADSEYARRFEREAQAIAQLDHPNIVSLYRYGNANGLLYMAMQYIEGSDLRHMMDGFQADGEFIDPQEALRIIREVGRGLDYIHKRGVIHRDIKPSNIMLTEDGTAIIADFGLALMVDVGTRGEIFGTPHYISPEQAVSSARVVPQSDIYALGVILYEMFTNRLPFSDGEPLDIAMAHVSETPPPPRSFRPELSPAIEQVILKSLAKEVGDRHQSGKELATALEGAIRQSAARSEKTTLPRHSIVERVHLDMEANPLPPIPAAITPPPKRAAQRQEPSLVGVMSAQQGGQAAEPTVKGASRTDAETRVAAPPTTRPSRPKSPMVAYAPYAVGGAVVALIAIIILLVATRDSSLSDDDLAASSTAIAAQNATELAAFITQTSSAAPTLSTNTAVPTEAPTETAVPSEVPTNTAAPTQAPIDTAAPAEVITVAASATQITSAPQTATITLFIYTERDKALRIVNVSAGETALVVAPLLIIRSEDDDRLRDANSNNNPDNPRQIPGTAWAVPFLASGDCLDALKGAGEQPPSDTPRCVHTTRLITSGDANKSWDRSFRVYYGDRLAAECENDQMCQVQIEVFIDG